MDAGKTGAYLAALRKARGMTQQEAADQRLILEYIRLFPDNILTRDNEIAHLSSSGFVVNADGTGCSWPTTIFTGWWAWTGGHADGEGDLLSVACGRPGRRRGWSISVPSARHRLPGHSAVWGHVKRGKWVPPSASQCILPAGGRRERRSRSGRGRTAGWAGFRRSACWSTPTSGRWTACTPSCWPGRGSCCGTHKWIAWTCLLKILGQCDTVRMPSVPAHFCLLLAKDNNN